MKTFGKVLLSLGSFTVGIYAGAFISAYVAEKVMDSPLDESVLRKHARTNKSKLDYTVLYTPKSSDPNLQSDEDDSYDDNDIVLADYKGSVKTFDDLPKNAEIGDTYLVEDADNGKGCIYFYSKNGYKIPKLADGVSLNDVFRFNMDAPQDDTASEDTDTVSNTNS